MIKLFGKIRYHWQPELVWFITYWSWTLTPMFLSIILIYEYTRTPLKSFLLFALFLLLAALGLQRCFIIEPDGYLKMVSVNIFRPKRLAIAEIAKVEVTKTTLALILTNGKHYLVSMRKWPKKYFLDALAVHPDFQGEVELLDNLIQLDYFELYQDEKKAPNQG